MTPQHWLAIAFAVVMLVWQFWPAVSGLLGKVKLPSLAKASGTSTPTYADASAALSTLARYKTLAKDQPEYGLVLAALKQMEAA